MSAEMMMMPTRNYGDAISGGMPTTAAAARIG